jgi:hypothetical protein
LETYRPAVSLDTEEDPRSVPGLGTHEERGPWEGNPELELGLGLGLGLG